MMNALLQDLRYACRTFAMRPAFVAVVSLTLAIGIGSTTSIFSVVYATLFRAVPFPEPDQLVMLYLTRTTASRGTVQLRWSYPRFQMLRQSATVFEQTASFTAADVNLTGTADPERIVAELVSASYFPMLRIGALRGRTFLPEDDATPGSAPVALIGYALWQRRFGADPELVGKTIGVNSTPLTVVGILPKGFAGLSGRTDLWVPVTMAPRLTYTDYLTTPQNFINVVGRLKRGISVAEAQAEMDTMGRRIDQAFPSVSFAPTTWSATASPLNTARIDPANRKSILVLFGAVSVLLLIACVNIASLLLGRANSRQREMAIRLALGSSRSRLIRQLLTESVLLALVGGTLGVFFALWGTELLSALVPGRIATPRNDYAQLSEFSSSGIDGTVLSFGILASLLAGIGFGLAPALRASRADLNSALKEGTRGDSREGMRLRRLHALPVLVVSEIALALVLLTCAGLLLRSFLHIQALDSGFDPTNVLSFWVNPPASRYRPADGPVIVEQLLDRVSAVPGVRSASVSRCSPWMSTCARTTLQLVGQPRLAPGSAPVVGRHYVAPDHFRTLGIRFLRGRTFTPQDRAGRPRVAIVNQTAAHRFWPGEDPIGKRVLFGSDPPESAAEIVGMVGDVRYWPVEETIGPDFYIPYLQFTYPDTMIFVRADRDPMALVPAIREAVRSVDKNLPIYDVKLLDERSVQALSKQRFNATLLGLFATAAMFLAAIGVYGVMAYAVTQRTREIGIRMALGAGSSQVLALVLRQSLRLTMLGVVLGLAGSLAATRLLTGMLYGVSATDPKTYATVSLILAAVALVATTLPARRASKVAPMVALRHE